MNCFTNKTILITGATGLIGSHIVSYLLACNCNKVIAMGRSLPKLEKTFSEYVGNPQLLLFEHDINNPFPNDFAFSVDFLFHTASPISGDVIKTAPLDVIFSNINGVINCFDLMKKQKLELGLTGKVIVFSSATIYSIDHPEKTIVNEFDTNYSGSISDANAPYSESKRMIEVIANSYNRQLGIDILIARFSYVYGYNFTMPKTAFYEFVANALSGKDIVLNKSCLPRRDNIYVEDAVLGLMHLCQIGATGDVYNISSCNDGGNYAAIDEIAEAIVKASKIINPSSSISVKYRDQINNVRPDGLRLDNNKIKRTGWSVKYSLEEGIFETLLQYWNKYEIFD